ncbi:MAG: multicopper oxidase domain-containing protein [Gammaproteobacteria bacterium]|jgi:FtsP/CotA-like multicopper oxidase with cupredoxin domain|nr:multicopper oxidase domain-containing protein [Gammaproteobacteria bacterium]
MNKRFLASAVGSIVLAALAAGCASIGSSRSAPRVLEVDLTARISPVTLTEAGLQARAYTFNGSTPGPTLRLNVGDTAVIHFTNELPHPTAVHWHGIELDNANDGTTVTQDLVPTGASFTYRFVATRPGLFWYHPHSMPTNDEFKGLYGAIIVSDQADKTLVAAGVLPPAEQDFALMLADTTVCKAPGENDTATFAADPDTPWAFSESIGPFPGLVSFPSPRDLCETPRDRHGKYDVLAPLQAGDIPNVMPAKNCSGGGNTFGQESKGSCRVNEGQLVLTNGQVVAARAGSPAAPGALAGRIGINDVQAGSGVRLRLWNAAVSRYFRLRLTTADGRQLPLLRVGGEGGLLDQVRIEGGTRGTLDTKYAAGELVLGVANRIDAVFAVPADALPGDILTLWTLDYQHYGTAQYPYGYGGLPTVPVAHFRVTATGDAGAAYQLAAGDPLRTHDKVREPLPTLRAAEIDSLLDPQTLAGGMRGTDKPEFLLAIVGLRETIDGLHGTLLEGGGKPHDQIPHLPTTRYARLGDTLELTFRNGTQMHHPMHLHGFSYQPLRLTDLDGNTVYEYDYNEFVDTVDVPAVHSLVMRVHLEDRPQIATGESGGGAGRWLLHCHIFNHAGLGMITEIVVLPAGDLTDAT